MAATQGGVLITLTSAAGKTVNAAGTLGVVSLGIGHGDIVTRAATDCSRLG
jgi:phosphocarrier protein HPr